MTPRQSPGGGRSRQAIAEGRRPSNWVPVVHWPSVRGRARADRGPLALVAGVVLIVTLLAAAVPPMLRTTADEAARDAIRRAGPDATVQVDARWPDDYGPTGGRVRDDDLADDVDLIRKQALQALDPSLQKALEPPVTTVTGTSLVVTDGSIQRRFQLNYVQNVNGGPAVTWVSGRAPGGTAKGDPEVSYDAPPWEVQVGLSEAEAAQLKLGPGDHVPVEDEQRNKYNVLVSGIFRPVDREDPAWRLVPWVLQPVPGLDGAGSTRLGGLLTAESLPDARLALLPDQSRRTVWFAADPDALTWESAQRLASTVIALKASSGSSAQRDQSLKWDTRLDGVLLDVRARVNAAFAQASVLLIAVLAGAVLVLLLTADLLARRRSVALIAARQRGAGLPTFATELLIESAAVTLPAAAVGIGLSWLIAGGAAIGWSMVVVLCALAAGPAFGTLTAARATRDRRQPANRAARRREERTTQLRRAAIDLAVVAAAVGALFALHQRGIVGGSGGGLGGAETAGGTTLDGAAVAAANTRIGGGDTALPASAPTLGVLAGALLLLRLMPAATGLALRQFLRSRRALAVFAAARAAATATRALPLLVLISTVSLAAFAVTLDTTAARGTADGAWRTVGADARLDVSGDALASTPSLARQIAAAPGVTQVVTGQIIDSVRAVADGDAGTPALAVLDAAAFQRLLANNPLPDVPDLARLRTKVDGKIPVLVRSDDGSLRPGMTVRILRDGTRPIEVVAIGTAPEISGSPDVIVADARSGLADVGVPFVPDTVWVDGPGAARAIDAVAAGRGTEVVRADVLRDRRNAPLNAGLTALDRIAAGTLLALGLLGFALSAAASAPERWVTLARLRTLGLRPRDTYRVAAGELLPPVLVAALGGPLLGLLLVKLTFGALALRTLTAQAAAPVPVTPWWLPVVAAVLLLAALVATVAAEAAARRRRRLGEVLRVGG
ncbi:FtsX-like permease family protein [Cryptosporangium sp. NPDC051539]|uniref:FtsX-like permease family protein n=1 Tax=Cryptosporangium sp. NPDC051539 TaxID=3363962 RepID=UPI0037B7F833